MPINFYHICNRNFFFLTSVLVISVPCCCFFCVLSNDMLNVSIGNFSSNIKVTPKLYPQLGNSCIAPSLCQQNLDLVCAFSKAL